MASPGNIISGRHQQNNLPGMAVVLTANWHVLNKRALTMLRTE
jgi:hypothetical protein